MTILSSPELWLKKSCYTKRGAYLFPFAPNPRWSEASVFLVGLNPIESFREEFDSFEHYWAALTRHPEMFEDAYRKKYGSSVKERSRTRRRIAEFVHSLKPLNVLVTNLFAYPTVNPCHIPKTLKREPVEARLITQLISVCKPRVLFFHGREARLFANTYFKVNLDPYAEPAKQNLTVMLPGASSSSSLFAYHHFVGRVDPHAIMDRRLEQFAEQIRQRIACPL